MDRPSTAMTDAVDILQDLDCLACGHGLCHHGRRVCFVSECPCDGWQPGAFAERALLAVKDLAAERAKGMRP
jgi:hypothetical protein